MIALLDANMLIALFDAAHLQHQRAHQWLAQNRAHGWATCPLTQNACIRIISQSVYPGRLAVADIARRLRQAIDAPDHRSWRDTISICDSTLFDHSKMLTPKHLTDIYLLGLAVANRGRLVTFDRHIPTLAVVGVTPSHLEAL